MILGSGHPEVVGRIKEQVDRGTSYGAPTELEVELAQRLVGEAFPSIEMVRLVNSGTEAVMSAVRLARAFTGQDQGAEVRWAATTATATRCWSRRLGRAHPRGCRTAPASPPRRRNGSFEYNDSRRRWGEIYTRRAGDAAIIVEPVSGNIGWCLRRRASCKRCRTVRRAARC